MRRGKILFLALAAFIILCMLLGQKAAAALSEQSNLELKSKVVQAVNEALLSPCLTKIWDFSMNVRLIDADVKDNKVTLNLSNEILDYGLGSPEFEQVLHHIHFKVGGAIYEQLRNVEYFILIEGVPLHQLFPENNHVESYGSPKAALDMDMSIEAQSINGKRISISPGHGYYWDNCAGQWKLQRSYFWGIVEDFVNAEITMYLNSYLASTGADVRPTRNMSKTAGTGESGYPKWQEAARYYIKSLGAPSSVWNSCTPSTPCSGYDPNCDDGGDDIRSRPLYANWVNADILVSIHNNGGGGTGTEIWYDTTNGYQVESKRLADILQAKIVGAIRSGYNSSWVDRGVKGSNGGYGENRIATRPSVIIEIAFMDTQSPDNAALQNEYFKSLVATAISQSISDYFGGTDTTPPTISAFSVTPLSLTLGSSFNISYTVSDTGGSGLNRVELQRARDDNNNNTPDPGEWTEVDERSLSGNGPVSGSFSNTPSLTGTYWYGIHVVDNAGNRRVEPDPPGPIKVTVTTPCTYSISPTSRSHGSGAETGSVSVTTQSGCSWSAYSNVSWITITSGSSGTGSGTVYYSVSTNNSTSQRTGTINIQGQTFTVYQAGAACTYSISPTSRSHGYLADNSSVSVTTQSGCNWTATSNDSWITITSGASGSGSGTVFYSVATNTSTSSRTGTINIQSQIFTVSQAGITCTYSISPTSRSHGSLAENASVSVATQSGCNWTATSNDPSWITITSGSSGSGSGTVFYSVATNTSTSSRTGTINIQGQTFTVYQAGAACTYSISPTSRSHGSGVETGSVSVTTQSGCSWSASRNAAWITITSGSSGTGSGTVYYSVSANTSTSSRTGTINIQGQSFTVSQAGITCTYSISPTSRSHGSLAENSSVSVTTQSGCNWTATSNDPSWITITSGSSGSGSGTVFYSVATNTSASQRTGTINIQGQTFTVSQAGITCTYSISPTSRSHGSGAETGSVSITAPSGCSWTATSNAAWITITSGNNGTGNGTLYYSVSANSSTSSRNGTMSIAGQTFTVYQSGITCTYSISPTSRSHGSLAENSSVSVTTQSGCNWTATSNDPSWITITSGSSGSGSGTVFYSVATNTSASQRTGTINIQGQTFTVSQAGITCTYSISPTSRSHGSGAETGSVSVTTQSGCNWTATSSANWITITSGSSGTGSGTVNYSVAANTSTSSRTGTINIQEQTFTVSQAGITCTYSISPTSRSHGSLAENSSVSVTTQSGCNWTATSNDPSWITITSGSSGSGSGTVFYSVATNTSASQRTGTINIQGQTFTVYQAGAACTYSISPTSRSHGSGAETGSVSVTAQSGCSWTATSNVSWITITSGSSGSGSGTVYYSVEANSSTSLRTGTITITSQTFTVNQSGAGGNGTAARDLPDCYTPSILLPVTITVAPSASTQAYAVEETPPNGWTISDIIENGQWDNVNNKVKWGPFFDHNNRTLTYNATPPSGETGTKTLSGTASFDAASVVIGGESSVGKCVSRPHPADTNDDYRMGISEVTAYGSAWKTGQTWPTPPNPIPIEYVTNAAYLWKMGEVYHYDGSANPPWVSGAASVQSITRQASLQIPMASGTGSATRTLPGTYEPSVAVNVSISVNPGQGTQVYAVEETPPNSWVISEINESGQWDSVNRKVKWGVFFDSNNRTLTYKATPPVGETGAKTFSGTASFDGSNVPIGGDQTIFSGITGFLVDFDGDGKTDIFWRHTTSGQTAIWFMNGATITSIGAPGTVSDLNWQIKGIGDFNGDGMADVLWQNSTSGWTAIWFMNGATITSIGSPGVVSDSNWKIQGIGDFNGDGKADVLWRHATSGQTAIWFIDGNTISSIGAPGTVSDLNWQIKGIGDFNGDGMADVLWQHATSGQTALWLMNGSTITSIGAPGIVSDLNWQIKGIGDFDGDVKSDILWQHDTTGWTVVWFMNGAIVSSSQSPGVVGDLNWEIKGVGDFNGDGKVDVFWQHATTGWTYIWFMDGATISSTGVPAQVSDSNWQIMN